MAKEVAGFTPEKAKQISRLAENLRAKGLMGLEGFSQILNRDESDLPLLFRNKEESLTVPPYGCMQVVGTEHFEGRTYAQIKQPSADNDGCYIFNTLQEVPPNSFGLGSAGPWVRVLSEDLDPDAGTMYQAQNGSWEVEEGGNLLCAAGRDAIFPEFADNKINLMQVMGAGGGGTQGTLLIGFDTSGYCDASPEPQIFYVSLTRNNNDAAPTEQPSSAIGFPDNATLVYHGFSYDTTTGGEAYNTHVYYYMVCDGGFDLATFLESTIISDWVNDELNDGVPPNEQWILRFSGAPNNRRDDILDQIDDLLSQPSTYQQTDVEPLSLYLDCDTNLCSSYSPSLNVVGREIRVKITERTCGVSRVPEEDDEGYVTVRDTLGSFLYGRKPEEITCRRGVAVWVKTEGEYDCHWMIIWMDMFDEIQVVHDIIIGTRGIEIERKRIDVWRECDLPDEYIEGNTCEAS